MPNVPAPRLSPLTAALVAQAGGGVIAAALIELFWPAPWQTPLAAALLQALGAASLARMLRAPAWWQIIHLLFVPLLVIANGLRLAPAWWLGGFVLLLLLFWRTDKSRVPLYLTNATTAAAVVALLPMHPCRVLDLGCGDGGLLRRMACARPDCEFLGIEHAPLPWLWARLAAAGLPNLRILHGDFWSRPLNDCDLVYAFLSPAPMPRLWDKARAEMRPDALLVSNSFAVPDIAPEQALNIADGRRTRLYIYRPGCGK